MVRKNLEKIRIVQKLNIENIIDSKKSLDELLPLLESISLEEYQLSPAKYDQSSIGAHVRHILEFYFALLNHRTDQCICYDDRDRNLKISQNPKYAMEVLLDIQKSLDLLQEDARIELEIKGASNRKSKKIQSNLSRELAFLIEHNTHHMALIRYMMKDYVKSLEPLDNFGYANSTIDYQKSQSEDGKIN